MRPALALVKRANAAAAPMMFLRQAIAMVLEVDSYLWNVMAVEMWWGVMAVEM